MANRIRCAFCDYVMSLPTNIAMEADARGRVEWMCEGCGSPVVIDVPASADANAAKGPSVPRPNPAGSTVPSPSPLEAIAKASNTRGSEPPEGGEGKSRSSSPPPLVPNVAARAGRRPPPPPPPVFGAARVSLPPPLPPSAGRSSILPPPLPAMRPPPLPTQLNALADGTRVSGVQTAASPSAPTHPSASVSFESLAHKSSPTSVVSNAISAAPATVDLSESGRPRRDSTPELSGEVTMRSVQVPRWVIGTVMLAMIGGIATGGVLVQRGLVSFKSPVAHATPSESSPKAATGAQPAAMQGRSSAGVVQAAFADAVPAQAPVAAAPERSLDAATQKKEPSPKSEPAKSSTKEANKEERAARDGDAKAKADDATAKANEAAASDASAPKATDEATASTDEKASADAKSADAAAEAKTEESETAAEAAPPAPPFDKSAASIALSTAEIRAQSCRNPGDPGGVARVMVTFATSGRVTSASITGEPFAGTTTGGCIANAFRGSTVPAYSGSIVTVTKSVVFD